MVDRNNKISVDNSVMRANIQRIIGQTFKLLPTWEEGKDWWKPLDTLLNELIGLFYLFPEMSTGLIVISKLEGLRQQGSTVDFVTYRRIIFECCSLLSKISEQLGDDK